MSVHQWLSKWSSWIWPILANHLWQSTLLALIAIGALVFLRKAPGRSRYAVLLIASAKFAFPSVLIGAIAARLGINISALLSSKAPAEPPDVFYQLTAPLVQFDSPVAVGAETTHSHNELFCALTLISMAVSATLLALWWRDRRHMRRATRLASLTATTRETLTLDRVKTWLGITRNVRLRVVPQTVEPGVLGVWRPIIVLPESMAEQLSDDELEAVMMHEMIHVARWDNLASNLQRFLCCLFWFNPIVWLLDRWLLSERERACDDEVIRLSGASDAYVSSLVKVLRFCLGWNVAGASNAAGSNLGRRVERIMSEKRQTRVSVLNRAAVWSIATLVIILSIAAGLLTRTNAVAQNTLPDRGVTGGVPGGVSGGIASTLHPVKISEFVGTSTDVSVIRWLKDVGDSVNRDDPLLELSIGNRNINVPSPASGVVAKITVAEGQIVSADTIVAVIESDPRVHDGTVGGVPGGVPGGVQGGVPGGVSGEVVGVVSMYGWAIQGNLIERLDQAAESAIEFKNSAKSPLSITDAKVKQVPRGKDGLGDEYIVVPIATLTNNTDRRIKGFTLEFRNGLERRAYYERVPSLIDAHATFTSGQQKRSLILPGGASGWSLRVAGVLFEDGDAWGMVPPPPPPPPPPTPGSPKPPPPPPPVPDSSKFIRKSGGVLVTNAVNRVNPEYPALAKQAGVTGTVVVEITVDETGNVISAAAVSGHPLLKAAAVEAARQWQFTPTTLSGEPVKVIGTLTFNFNL